MTPVFLLALLAQAPPPKGPVSKPPVTIRGMSMTEEEAEAARAFDSKEAREIPMPDAGAPHPPFRWKLSNVLREIRIDGIQMVNDTPVRLHSVVVKGRLEDVLSEIYIHFVKSGLYVQPLDKQDQVLRQVQMTGLDTYRAISYTAMVEGMADGSCMVVLGEADIAESTRAGLFRQATKKGFNDFAPMMPNAQGPTRVKIEGMETLSYQVSASEADVKKFYEGALPKAGYTLAEGVYRKGTEEIQVTVQRDKELMSVLLTKRTRPANDAIAEPLRP